MKNTEFPEYEAEVDPVGFSFFLSANIPVESSSIQILLEAECVVQRLRYKIIIFEFLCVRLLSYSFYIVC